MAAPRHTPAIAFTWHTRPDEAELALLLAHLDDGSLLAIDDQEQVWSAFFTSRDARDRALDSLAGLTAGLVARAVDVADDGWAERSQAALEPVRVGSLVITPPWHAAAARKAAAAEIGGTTRIIVIRPAMGFGTGHHASTRRCLSLMQSLDLAACSVIDIGTGSAVLAIAAWMLGASPVTAIDYDVDALASAHENVDENQALGVRLVEGDLATHQPARPYDVALANLTGATLIAGAGRLATLVRPRGTLVASGVEREEARAVGEALGAAGWREVTREVEDEWVGLVFQRAATSPTASTAS